ncbi:MAG: class I SAM-dependent methyltransferase [Desulfovibrio sp.]|nr:class I SAM-dependent methyltransferase [Desulfovibrio sp.]
MREALLEPLLRRMRMSRVLPVLRRYPGCRLLDVGCGFNHRLLSAVEPHVAEAWGIDRKAPELRQGRLNVVRATLDTGLPFADARFDVVTMLAVLEHLDQPLEVVREVERVLRPGGRLVLTVPAPAAKPVLEFLAFRLGLVSAEEIRDHKRYYGRAELFAFLADAGALRVEALWSFQLGFNTACVALKDEAAAL